MLVPAAAAETNGGFIFRIQIRILVFLMCVADACPTVPVEISRLPSAKSADLCDYLAHHVSDKLNPWSQVLGMPGYFCNF